MSGAVGTLTTTLSTYQKVQTVEAANISRYGTDSPRQQVELAISTSSGNVTGLVLSGTSSAFDEQLAKTMRDFQAKTAALQRLDDTNMQLEQRIFGAPGQSASFFHSLSSMSANLKTLATDGKSFAGALSGIQQWTQDMVSAGNAVQAERQRADADLASSVVAVNKLLQDIASFNQQISQATGIEQTTLIDQRRGSLHELSAYIGIQTIPGSDGYSLDVMSSSQAQLVIGTQAVSFSVPSAAAPAAATVYAPVTFTPVGSTAAQVDATSMLMDSNGRMASLLNIRDKFLPGVQEQIDVIAQQTAQVFNELHNQGTSRYAPNTLTGEILPGGTSVVSTTGVSGTGTIRIGVMDKVTGDVAMHVDINLATITTVDDIVTAINSGVGGGVTATINNGVLVLAANDPTKGVVVGHAASDLAEPSIGFSTGIAYTRGFSNFFGLNNLFADVNQNGTVGFSQALKIRPDIVANSGLGLSLAYAKHPASGAWSVGNQSTQLVADMGELTASASVTFPLTAQVPGTTDNIRSYALSFLDRQVRSIQANRDNLNNTSQVLAGLSEQAYNQNGVDIHKEFMLMQQYAQNADIVIAAIAVINEMIDEILNRL